MARRSWFIAVLAFISAMVVINAGFYLWGPFLEESFSSAQVSAYWDGWSAVGAVLVGVGVPGAVVLYETQRSARDRAEHEEGLARERDERARLERARFSAAYIVAGHAAGATKTVSWNNAASTPWLDARILIATDKQAANEFGADRKRWYEATGQQPGPTDSIYRIELGTVVPGNSDSADITLPAYAGILTFRHPLAEGQLRWSPLGGPISPFIPNVAGDRPPLEL